MWRLGPRAFLFSNEQLNQPVSRLSGGERARVLIANLMLESADVLLLDEPTNDLDIPTLEILEESLVEFPGSLVLVTHDRYLLDRVSTTVVGLDGEGKAELFADYSQWQTWVDKKAQQSKVIHQYTQRNGGGKAAEKAVVPGKPRMGRHGSAHCRSGARYRTLACAIGRTRCFARSQTVGRVLQPKWKARKAIWNRSTRVGWN